MIPEETYEGALASGWDEYMTMLDPLLYDWYKAGEE